MQSIRVCRNVAQCKLMLREESVQKNSNQKAGATSHQPHSRDIAIATINVHDDERLRIRVRMT